jgi:hypothetical protein
MPNNTAYELYNITEEENSFANGSTNSKFLLEGSQTGRLHTLSNTINSKNHRASIKSVMSND